MQIFKYLYVISDPPSPVSADSECNRIKNEYLNILKNLNICILSRICKPVTHKTSAHHKSDIGDDYLILNIDPSLLDTSLIFFAIPIRQCLRLKMDNFKMIQ